MRSTNQLVIASQNRGKCREFRELGRRHDQKVIPLSDWVRNSAFLSEIEDLALGSSYEDNARHKCLAAFQAAKLPTFADDSGLEVLALDGQPGIRSGRLVQPSAGQSQDQALREKIISLLKGKKDKEREARFVCTLVFMVEGWSCTVRGVCEGMISEDEHGGEGFGYDPIFIPRSGDGRTMAELTLAEKNLISHRALAFAELMKVLKEEKIELVHP